MDAAAKTMRALDFLVVVLTSFYIYALLKRRKRFVLLPGPSGWPILGNTSELLRERQPLHWSRYKEVYGPITRLTVLGKTFLIINDQKIAFELLDRRSAMYSNRPRFYFSELQVSLFCFFNERSALTSVFFKKIL